MELLKLALRNLIRRRVRTSLTVLGVTVAIAFTVGLLSISEGFIVTTNRALARQGEHILVLPEEMAFHPLPLLEALGSYIPEEYLDRVRRMDNVKGAYPVFTQTLMVGPGMASWLALNGVTPAFLEDLRPYLKLESGRFFDKGERDVVVVGSLIAKMMKLRVGDKLDLRGRELKVIGILKPGGGLFEDFIGYAPLGTVQELMESEGRLTSIAVTVNDLDRAAETAEAISRALPGVRARTREETLGQMMDFITRARAIHFSVASIALLIGILFVLSTMMMAVSERVKEIGVLRALGASRGLVFRLILGESLMISLGAGILGCAAGYGLSKAIVYGVSLAVGEGFLQPMVTPRILAIGLVTSLLVGAIAGLYPAWRTSRTNIVEALRYE